MGERETPFSVKISLSPFVVSKGSRQLRSSGLVRTPPPSLLIRTFLPPRVGGIGSRCSRCVAVREGWIKFGRRLSVALRIQSDRQGLESWKGDFRRGWIERTYQIPVASVSSLFSLLIPFFQGKIEGGGRSPMFRSFDRLRSARDFE